MDKLMQEGGIAGSDVTQEPVTGNEVPPGAMPSEVRDDVSAQLSEGEYVVPADVVRFFGVKFFEDLRSQAKQGLSQMQSDGRIGGASVDGNGIPMDQEEDQLTPEEEQMLNEALGKTGMAYGGTVMGMVDGGDVPFDRSTFTLTDPVTSEKRKYIDPKTGTIKEFSFLFGSPTESIPVNFVPWTQALEDASANVTAPVVKPVTGGTPEPKKESWADTHPVTPPTTTGETGGGIGGNKWATENYEAVTTDPAKFGMEALEDDTGKLLSQGLTLAGAAIPAVAGPAVVGGAVVKAYNKIENIANANASLQIMKAQGKENTPEYAALQTATKAKIEALPTVQQAMVENGLAGTGDRLFKQWQEEDDKRKGKTDTGGGTGEPPVGGDKPKQIVPTGGDKPKQIVPTGGDKSDSKPTGGNVGASGVSSPSNYSGYTSAGTGSSSKSSSSGNVGASGVSSPSNYSGYTSAGTSSPTKAPTNAGSTRFKEGGLVTKNIKTTPKSKGLAGKQ